MKTMPRKIKKVVLAYSGGLDTSIAIHWLKKTYRCQVVAFCADLGQGDDFGVIRKKALAAGASKVIAEDLREDFAQNYLFPILRANAVYEGSYLLGTSIARPLIAKRQVEIARQERADAVAHGATGKGNDQVRFELTYSAMDPSLRIIAPWREWEFRSRSDLMDYAKQYGIPVPTTKRKPYSIDENLFHTSYEGGILENPWAEPPEEIFRMTVPPQKAPEQSATVEIGFKGGNPTTIDGKHFTPAALIVRLNQLGGGTRHRPGGSR